MSLRDRFAGWPQGRAWKIGRLVVATAASGGLAWVALHALDWGRVFSTFQEFPVGYGLISLLPLTMSIVLRSYRWRVLLSGERVNGWQVFLVQNTGIGLNNLLPVRMMSEPVQLAVIVRRYHVPGPTALATLVAGNTLDIFATALLMALGVLVAPGLRGLSIQLFGAFIMFIVSILVFIVVARGLGAIPVASRMRFFQQLTVAVNLLRESPMRLWASFGATLAHWFLLGLTGWVLTTGLGMDLNILVVTTLLVAATFFTSAVPSLPGAVGTYEFAMIYSLGLLGVDDPTAFAFAVVIHFLVFVPTTVIALVMLSRLGVDLVFKRDPQGPAPVARETTAPRASL